MMYLATTQTPVYIIGPDGFFKMQRSAPAGTEFTIQGSSIDDKSDRPIGLLQTGEIVYLDKLTKVMEEVVVKGKFSWWYISGILLLILIVLIVILKSNS